METSINKIADTTVITVCGRLDTASAADFMKRIEPLAKKPGLKIELECEDLEYISSSGLRAFIFLLKGAQAGGGSVKVRHLNTNVNEVFQMTGFASLFDID